MLVKFASQFKRYSHSNILIQASYFTESKQTTQTIQQKNNENSNNQIRENIKMPIFHHIQEILNRTQLKTQQSIFIEQKKQKHKDLRILTQQEKLLLGINIPKKPLKRLTQVKQKQYLQVLTSKLYEKQSLIFNDRCVKILQRNNLLSTKLDEYINLLYKDTYARFLVSKGIRVSWNSYKSSYGIMNASSMVQEQKNFSNKYIYEQLLKIFYYNSDTVKLKNTIGLYSSRSKKFVSADKVDMEIIKKIGYFHRIQLTYFGKYTDSFNILKEKGQKIYLLVYTDYLHKLVDPDALCVSQGTMLTLVRDIQQNQVIKEQFLITSLENYLIHQTYFNKNKYRKHNSFDSKHLLDMKCRDLSIIPQSDKYSRKPGIYTVKGANSLQDFDRLLNHNIEAKPNIFINQNGEINFGYQKVNICDATCSQKLYKMYLRFYHSFTGQYQQNKSLSKQLNIFSDFVELYESFQDQIFYHTDTKQVLFFQLTSKIIIELNQKETLSFKAKEQLIQQLSGESPIIIQSKVSINSPSKFHKPRQKRRWKKEVRKTQQQMTSYPRLLQAIQDANQLQLSSLNYSQQMNIFPIFVAVINNQYRLLKLDKNIYSKIKAIIQNDRYSLQQFKKLEQEVRNIFPDYKLQFMTISPKFQQNLNFIYQQIEDENQFDSALIIQPQHSTESYLPQSLLLNSILKNCRTAGGRSVRKTKKNKQCFSMIKLHPTFIQSQSNISIQDIIYGTLKANKQQQYGYGLQALKLWVFKHDNLLGDRKIADFQINQELKLSSFIRNLYSDILTIYPKKFSSDTKPPSSYIDIFLNDHIDFYILNMQHYLKTLDLYHAYKLTQEFYEKYIQEIYLKTIRKNMIAYKNWNTHHATIMNRIIQLLGILSIMMPFSAYHVAKEINAETMPWPKLSVDKEKFVQLLGKVEDYNRMVKFRTELKNKIQLNNFHGCWLQLVRVESSEPDKQTGRVKRTIVQVRQHEDQIQRIALNQLAQFLDVNIVSYNQPKSFNKKFKLALRKNHPFMDEYFIIAYQFGKNCIRCDPDSKQKQILCQKCLKYLKQQVCQ